MGLSLFFGFYFLIFTLYTRRCVVIITREMRVAGTNGNAGGRQGELPRVHAWPAMGKWMLSGFYRRGVSRHPT